MLDIPLNGEWLFIADSADFSTGLPSEAVTVSVPHTYNIMDGLEDYAGKAWYEKRIEVPADLKGCQLKAEFEAVYHDAFIYVNGKLAGSHAGKGYTPFTVDITKYVKYGQENTLVVGVNNAYSASNFPYMRSFDWANDGGIYRKVNLHVTGSKSIRYAHFTPQLSPADSIGTCKVSIRLHEPQVKGATFGIKVFDKQTHQPVFQTRTMLRRSRQGTFETTINCGRVLPWHFDHPNLYGFEVSVIEGGTVSDTRKGHFGFRNFQIEGNRFVLNGEPVRLPGIETMPGSNPDFGMAEPEGYIQESAAMLKDLNTTITRFHWIQGEDMLNALDSLGILAQEELSWWQQPRGQLTPEQEALAKETIAEMIEAHYNHPCIYAWAVSNEVRDNQAAVANLGAFIKELDPSRMAESVGNRIYQYLDDDPSLLLDIPTWNEYIGTWHGSGKKIREELPDYFAKISPVLNGRPLFITEYGLCEPAFVGGDRRRTDDMLYHIKEWMRQEFVTGYIYFCLEDYRTQMGEEGLGRHRIRRHGITDNRHHPKPSYYVLRDLMSPVEIDKVQPSTAVRDNKTLAGVWETKADDRTLIVGIAVKNSIPSYTLRGYTLKYVDAKGSPRSIALPTMEPGQRYEIALPEVNDCFKFKICRPDGGVCMDY
ncbi:MAG: hypothetical protein IJV45_05650 [Prevotella sp.]|nr:hypothetical protein [Prevotella sp.]